MEQFATVQVALKLGNIALLAVITTHLIEDFDEHREQGVDLGLADDVGLLVDVEQDAFRGNGDSFLELGAQQLVVVLDLG
ncbi:hypothetical protein D3C71_1768970 [compost metagenome]